MENIQIHFLAYKEDIKSDFYNSMKLTFFEVGENRGKKFGFCPGGLCTHMEGSIACFPKNEQMIEVPAPATRRSGNGAWKGLMQ